MWKNPRNKTPSQSKQTKTNCGEDYDVAKNRENWAILLQREVMTNDSRRERSETESTYKTRTQSKTKLNAHDTQVDV